MVVVELCSSGYVDFVLGLVKKVKEGKMDRSVAVVWGMLACENDSDFEILEKLIKIPGGVGKLPLDCRMDYCQSIPLDHDVGSIENRRAKHLQPSAISLI